MPPRTTALLILVCAVLFAATAAADPPAGPPNDMTDEQLLAEAHRILDGLPPDLPAKPLSNSKQKSLTNHAADNPAPKDPVPVDRASAKVADHQNAPIPAPPHPALPKAAAAENPAADDSALAALANSLKSAALKPDDLRRFADVLSAAANNAPPPASSQRRKDSTNRSLNDHPPSPTPSPTMLPEVAAARREASKAQADLAKMKLTLEHERSGFQSSLQTARSDHRSEMDEMRATIDEQKRAFDELFEEKRIVSRILTDEQKTLRELQDKVQHPDLSIWIRQRAKRAAVMMETPETGAIKYYAKKFMAPKVDKMRHRIEILEQRVERTVDHLLPAQYGYFVAITLSFGLVAFPLIVSLWAMLSCSKKMSLRQYVLLGNIFLSAFALALCVAGVLLRQDPLQTLYEAGESLFISLQLVTAISFPLFLAVLLGAVLHARDRLDMFVFGCEFIFYVLVGLNYRARVWRPTMLGQNIETSPMMYFVYLMDFVSMTALTISSARMDPIVMQAWKDVESGFVETYAAAIRPGPVMGNIHANSNAGTGTTGVVMDHSVTRSSSLGGSSRGRPIQSGGEMAAVGSGLVKKAAGVLQLSNSVKDE